MSFISSNAGNCFIDFGFSCLNRLYIFNSNGCNVSIKLFSSLSSFTELTSLTQSRMLTNSNHSANLIASCVVFSVTYISLLALTYTV